MACEQPPTCGGPPPDDALLAALAALRQACADLAQHDRDYDPSLDRMGSAYAVDREIVTGELLDRWSNAAETMVATPAQTHAGVRAKALAMRLVLERLVCDSLGATIEDLKDEGEFQDCFAWSLARDVLAVLGDGPAATGLD